MWVPVAVRRVANCYTPFTFFTFTFYNVSQRRGVEPSHGRNKQHTYRPTLYKIRRSWDTWFLRYASGQPSVQTDTLIAMHCIPTGGGLNIYLSLNYSLIHSFIHSLTHSFIVKSISLQQTCMHDYEGAVENNHLHMNKNNKNTKAGFKTQNTLAMPKTMTSKLFIVAQIRSHCPSFSANPSHFPRTVTFSFLLQDWLQGFRGLFTDTFEHSSF